MIMYTIFEKVLKRLLKESRAPDESLAAFTHRSGDHRIAVLYNPADIVQNYEEILNPDQLPKFFEGAGTDIIKGVVAIRPINKEVSGNCWGAWQIAYIAGPGWGHMLYPLAQAMSPKGLLTPDRNDVSPPASGAWQSSLKLGRARKPFDDFNNPKTPPVEDDCIIHPGEDHLNWAYASSGSEENLLNALRANHESTMSQIPNFIELPWFTGNAKQKITWILQEEGDIFVDKHISTSNI